MGRKPAQEGIHQDLLTPGPAGADNAGAASGTIGLTIGDVAGIGPEVVRKALDSGKLDPRFHYRLVGNAPDAVPGQPTHATAAAAIDSLEESAQLVLAGEIDAVVTAPVSKFHLQQAGFDFPGQTEFFAARAGVTDYAMCLTGGPLTVALVTAHIPLRDVASVLRRKEIVRVARLLAGFLALRHRRAPRVAIAGLNPHAGESGTLGREELDRIAPAIEELRQSGGAEFAGPFSPDTIFHQAARGEWDGVVCMYHDQGLIPLKLIAFDQGVNVTLGLPFIRTSPDHGTGFDIAGKTIARPDSMIAAINLAAKLCAARKTTRPD